MSIIYAAKNRLPAQFKCQSSTLQRTTFPPSLLLSVQKLCSVYAVTPVMKPKCWVEKKTVKAYHPYQKCAYACGTVYSHAHQMGTSEGTRNSHPRTEGDRLGRWCWLFHPGSFGWWLGWLLVSLHVLHETFGMSTFELSETHGTANDRVMGVVVDLQVIRVEKIHRTNITTGVDTVEHC